MKTTLDFFKMKSMLLLVFLFIAGYSQAQNNCVPDSLTASNVTIHAADLNWTGITGPTWVRYYPTGTTNYLYREARHGNHVHLDWLLSATAYTWDLNNFCNGQWTGYQGNGSFTTLTDTVPVPTCMPDSMVASNVGIHTADVSWTGISGPTWVRYYPAGTTDYRYREAHHGNNVHLDHLIAETAYAWDLNNFCNGQWTGYQGIGAFTTLADTVPPQNCIPDSLNATNVGIHTADLTWTAITGPTWVRYYPTGTTNYKYKDAHVGHQMHLDHLTAETAYSWDLNNFCNGQWTGYQGTGAFTTLADTIPPPTCTPDSLTATNVGIHSADLSWTGITGKTWVRYYPAGTTNYKYLKAHGNSIHLFRLAAETDYLWDLNNFCNGQWTGYLGNGSFTTLADTVPAPVCIPDSMTAANVTAHGADLSWGGISGWTWVRYYPAGTTEYRYRKTHNNTVRLTRLISSTTYTWDLNNFCDGTWTGYQGNGSFTTIADTVAPTCIPTNLSDTNVTAHTAGLSWEGIHGPTRVRYYVTGTTDYLIKDVHCNHTTLLDLAANTTYSWDLSNLCEGTWTPYTGDGSFTTLPEQFRSAIVSGNSTAEDLSAISVYPNPMRERTTVSFTSRETGSCQVKLIDITGRTILNDVYQASSGNNTLDLNLSDTPKGIYFLYIQKGSENKHIKVIRD